MSSKKYTGPMMHVELTPWISIPQVSAHLDKLEASLGVSFANRTLLFQTCFHGSCREFFEKHKVPAVSNARLAVFGDAVLRMIIIELIDEHFVVNDDECNLLLSWFVSDKTFLRFARTISLGPFLKINLGNAKPGRLGEKNLTNFFEAIVGAYYADTGHHATKTFILEKFFIPELGTIASGEHLFSPNHLAQVQIGLRRLFGKVLVRRMKSDDGIRRWRVLERETGACLIEDPKEAHLIERLRMRAKDSAVSIGPPLRASSPLNTPL